MTTWEETAQTIQVAQDAIDKDHGFLSSAIDGLEGTQTACDDAARQADELASANNALMQFGDASIANSVKDKIEEARTQLSALTEQVTEAREHLTAANTTLDAARQEVQTLEGS